MLKSAENLIEDKYCSKEDMKIPHKRIGTGYVNDFN